MASSNHSLSKSSASFYSPRVFISGQKDIYKKICEARFYYYRISDDVANQALSVGSRFGIAYFAIGITSGYGVIGRAGSYRPDGIIYESNYTHGQLERLTIKLSNTGHLLQQRGRFVLGFWPFRTPEDHLKVKRTVPKYNDVCNYGFHQTGTASDTVSITYVPDSNWAKGFHPLRSQIGICDISYEDLARTSSTKRISPQDFLPNIEISGRMKFDGPTISGYPGNYQYPVISYAPFGEVDDGLECNPISDCSSESDSLEYDFCNLSMDRS